MMRLCLLLGVALGVAGCSNVRSRIPFYYHDQTASSDPGSFVWNAHRQYFDKLHKRFYYYDPAKKAYFWENGQPKG